MGDVGFFICLAAIGAVAYSLGEALQIRRRRLRARLVEGRSRQSDRFFQERVSTLEPVPEDFVRAFRLAVGRALSVDPGKLLPSDRLRRDLRAVSLDAMELSSLLERSFDVRVRLTDLVRARTLRVLCKLLHERASEPSEYDPPLHRDPVPKLRAPEPEVVVPGQESS